VLTATDLARRTLQRVGAIPVPAQAPAIPDDPIAWIESEFYIPELQGPMTLAPYQKAVLREAYRLDAQGHFVYSVVLWSDIKKSAKSSIAAATVLERARRLSWGSIKIVANDLKQADSRVAFYARRAIELNPRLTNRVKVKPSGYHMEFDNRTRIEAVPVDPKGEAGGNDDLIVFSELWAANQTAAQRMWTEMTLSPTKYGKSQRWVETYAGFSGESPLLEQLYQTGVVEGRQLDLGIPGLEVYANDSARMLVLWNTQPRLPWQSPEYYAQEAAILLPGEFQRVHRNAWVTSENVFVPGEWWDACKGNPPDFASAAPVVVGMDAGVSNDCFALVGVSRVGDQVYVRFVRIWKPPKGGAIDFAEPERALRKLKTQYNVVQVAYDPYQLHDLATRLRRDGVAWFREFSQGQDRLIADKNLYDAIRDRRITHDGNTDLAAHIRNANAKTEGDKLRIVKRAEHLKVDCAVALSMAHAEARRLNL
jgi:phage terminase large subunit-like protein